jgi:hypothetical protein
MGKRNGYWDTHPKPELQELLMIFHVAGWRIDDSGSKYYKTYCPKPRCGKHKTTVHLSPSDPKYKLNKTKWLERQPCYNEGGQA